MQVSFVVFGVSRFIWLPLSDLRYSLICHGTVIDVFYSVFQLVETEVSASTSRQHDVVWIPQIVLCRPLGRPCPTIIGQVGAFREQKKPHWVEVRIPLRANLFLLQLVQPIRESRLVSGHFPRHEDEAIEHHASSDNGNVLERLLEDDVDMTMHTGTIRIADPPQVYPICVNLFTCRLEFHSCMGPATHHMTPHNGDFPTLTWWFAIMTMRSGNLNSTTPELVGKIWPATDSSPLMRMVVGPKICVISVMVRQKDLLVMAMYA